MIVFPAAVREKFGACPIVAICAARRQPRARAPLI